MKKIISVEYVVIRKRNGVYECAPKCWDERRGQLGESDCIDEEYVAKMWHEKQDGEK